MTHRATCGAACQLATGPIELPEPGVSFALCVMALRGSWTVRLPSAGLPLAAGQAIVGHRCAGPRSARPSALAPDGDAALIVVSVFLAPPKRIDDIKETSS